MYGVVTPSPGPIAGRLAPIRPHACLPLPVLSCWCHWPWAVGTRWGRCFSVERPSLLPSPGCCGAFHVKKQAGSLGRWNCCLAVGWQSALCSLSPCRLPPSMPFRPTLLACCPVGPTEPGHSAAGRHFRLHPVKLSLALRSLRHRLSLSAVSFSRLTQAKTLNAFCWSWPLPPA